MALCHFDIRNPSVLRAYDPPCCLDEPKDEEKLFVPGVNNSSSHLNLVWDAPARLVQQPIDELPTLTYNQSIDCRMRWMSLRL